MFSAANFSAKESDLPNFERLLGDGSAMGLNLSYKVQPSPDGLAQAFILGEEFIGDDCCAMVLGDNIFYGNGFSPLLKAADASLDYCKRAITRFKTHVLVGTYTTESVDGKFACVIKRKSYTHRADPCNTFEEAEALKKQIKSFAQTDIIREQ